MSEITSVPKAALTLAKNRTWVFLFIVVVVVIAVVAYEVRNPGKLRTNVAKVPLIGPKATKTEPVK